MKRKKMWLFNSDKEIAPKKRIINYSGIPTCTDRLKHLQQLGFSPKVIFDCGAFIGKWAASVAEIYPHAKFVLIEPNIELENEIKQRTLSIKKQVTLVQSAVADKSGEATLNIWANRMVDWKSPTARGKTGLLIYSLRIRA